VKVDHLMNSSAQTCSPEDNLAEVVSVLWHHDCGAVPVVGDDGKMIGIITDRDICMALSTNPRPAGEVEVNEVMSRKVHSCQASDNIHEAMETMRVNRVRRLPVIDDEGKLEGMLSISDVILHAEPVGKKRSPGVTCVDIVTALKGVCEPAGKAKTPGE
jgi:CBS domain-containing protein